MAFRAPVICWGVEWSRTIRLWLQLIIKDEATWELENPRLGLWEWICMILMIPWAGFLQTPHHKARAHEGQREERRMLLKHIRGYCQYALLLSRT